MNGDILILVKLAGLFLLLFAAAECLYHYAGVAAETTRKIVHIGTGLLTLLFPLWMEHVWQVVVLCLSFLGILALSRRYGYLKSINAISRKSAGSLLYPVIVIVVFIFYNYQSMRDTMFDKRVYFYLPILIMAICDPMAMAAGSMYKKRHTAVEGKTLAGSASFFVGAVLVGMSLLLGFGSELTLWLLFCGVSIALATTLAEYYTKNGWDNFSIPATAILCLLIIEHL